MKILFLCNEYPPRKHGGIGTSVFQLARRLAAEGHGVWVLGWHHDPKPRRQDGIEIVELPATKIPKLGWWLNRRRAAAEIRRIHQEHDLDLVEGPDWCGMAAGQNLPCPYIVRLNGSETYFGQVLGYPVGREVRWSEADNLRRATAVLSVSQFCWRETKAAFGLRGEATIVPNSVDCDRFRPPTTQRERPGTILYVGTVTRKKGVFELLRAFEELVRRRPSTELWIAGRDSRDSKSGSSSTLEALEASVSSTTWRRVRVLGAVEYSEVPGLLAEAAVCCFPSFAEALPMTWIEAMASGKALVASTRGPGPEVAIDGEEALLVDPEDRRGLCDALIALLEDPAYRQRLGAAARARCERTFSTDVVFRQNLAAYESMLARNRGA